MLFKCLSVLMQIDDQKNAKIIAQIIGLLNPDLQTIYNESTPSLLSYVIINNW